MTNHDPSSLPSPPKVVIPSFTPPSSITAGSMPPPSLRPVYAPPVPSPRPTSLEHRESNAHPPPCSGDRYQMHRHRAHAEQRSATLLALRTICTSGKVVQRFEDCGKAAYVQQHVTCPHLLRVMSEKCRHRFCPACQAERGSIIRRNIEFLAKTAKNSLKLLTLTLAHTSGLLRPQVDRLTRAFREMRRLKFWKDHVLAAVWVMEVKIGRDGRWHPHLHVILDSPYIPHATICAAWLACTQDSYIVDIRPISANKGAAYISKYVTKPIDASVWQCPDKLEEFILAIKGKRTCAALGTWRKLPLAERQEDEIDLAAEIDTSPGNWRTIGTFQEIIEQAEAGVPHALETLRLLDFPAGDSS